MNPIVTKITTHVIDAEGRLLQQYKGRPRVQGLLGATVTQIQDLEDAIFAVDAARQLWNGTSVPAVGAQLDAIGDIVGIKRNGLSDAEYILFIFGKIAENYSDTTIPTIGAIIGYLFQGTSVLIQNYYPASISFEVGGSTIPPTLYALARNLVQAALGAGIRLAFGAVSTHDRIFRFAGPGVDGALNGFPDSNVPGSGGVFVGLIK